MPGSVFSATLGMSVLYCATPPSDVMFKVKIEDPLPVAEIAIRPSVCKHK